jgi:hypothetical protein
VTGAAAFVAHTSLWCVAMTLAWAGSASAHAPDGRSGVVIEAYSVGARVPLRATFAGLAVDVHPGYVRVSEILHLQNGTKQTFLGEILISLPQRAQLVTFHDGWQRPTLDGDRIRDRLAIRPGTHRLTYAYSVRGAGTVDLDRQVAMPIDLLEIFTLAPAVTRGQAIIAAAPATSDGRTFNRASARAVAAGPLVLQVVGVPSDQRWPAPAAAAALATVLGVGLAVAVVRARGRPRRG